MLSLRAFVVAMAIFASIICVVVGLAWFGMGMVDRNLAEIRKKDEAERRWKLTQQTCELLGGKVFADGRCYRNDDGKIVIVEIPPLPEEP